jgi:hypothetical protein
MRKGRVSRRNPRSGFLRGSGSTFYQRLTGRSGVLSVPTTARSDHGFGSRGGIFSGSWVNSPNGRWMLAGLYPLHDAGTIFCFSTTPCFQLRLVPPCCRYDPCRRGRQGNAGERPERRGGAIRHGRFPLGEIACFSSCRWPHAINAPSTSPPILIVTRRPPG